LQINSLNTDILHLESLCLSIEGDGLVAKQAIIEADYISNKGQLFQANNLSMKGTVFVIQPSLSKTCQPLLYLKMDKFLYLVGCLTLKILTRSSTMSN